MKPSFFSSVSVHRVSSAPGVLPAVIFKIKKSYRQTGVTGLKRSFFLLLLSMMDRIDVIKQGLKAQAKASENSEFPVNFFWKRCRQKPPDKIDAEDL